MALDLGGRGGGRGEGKEGRGQSGGKVEWVPGQGLQQGRSLVAGARMAEVVIRTNGIGPRGEERGIWREEGGRCRDGQCDRNRGKWRSKEAGEREERRDGGEGVWR